MRFCHAFQKLTSSLGQRWSKKVIVKSPVIILHCYFNSLLISVFTFKPLSGHYAVADCCEVTLLGLLDQSATFDCVNHNILFVQFQQLISIRGKFPLEMHWHGSGLSSTDAVSKMPTTVSCWPSQCFCHRTPSSAHCFCCTALSVTRTLMTHKCCSHICTQVRHRCWESEPGRQQVQLGRC